MKLYLKSFINKLPHVRGLYQESLKYKSLSCFMPGHFYSPIVSKEDIKENLWIDLPDSYPIDMNINEQIKVIKEISRYYKEIPYLKNNDLRYTFENGSYEYTDGITLFGMIRNIKPKKIIEVGSGYSSALMLDINEMYFNNSIDLTFVEPYPTLLNKLLKENDKHNCSIFEKKIQDVDIKVFKDLKSGDILFIDSSHVLKTGSDLQHILAKILPILSKGVIIHFHDIFYPFEYPKQWIEEGRNWNENYFIKSFLMYNNNFKIILFSHYLHLKYSECFHEMPLSRKNTGGNLWIRKNI
jgi:predicted O-methyltransferase YrrM